MADVKLSKEEVPLAEFIDDVAAFMVGKDPDAVMKTLNDRHRALSMLDAELQQRKQRILTKLPEMEKAHQIVKKLVKVEGAPMTVDFELCPNVYTVASMEDVKTVNLWLGANVMVEYDLEEAEKLLGANVSTAKANLVTVNSDLDMIKESSTTTEVSLARVYNWDVENRRKAKETEEATA